MSQPDLYAYEADNLAVGTGMQAAVTTDTRFDELRISS
jgi:hypothetical protein